jgi:hypothetical protein
MAIEVEVDGKWQIVFQGRPGNRLSAFPPTETRRVACVGMGRVGVEPAA